MPEVPPRQYRYPDSPTGSSPALNQEVPFSTEALKAASVPRWRIAAKEILTRAKLGRVVSLNAPNGSGKSTLFVDALSSESAQAGYRVVLIDAARLPTAEVIGRYPDILTEVVQDKSKGQKTIFVIDEAASLYIHERARSIIDSFLANGEHVLVLMPTYSTEQARIRETEKFAKSVEREIPLYTPSPETLRLDVPATVQFLRQLNAGEDLIEFIQRPEARALLTPGTAFTNDFGTSGWIDEIFNPYERYRTYYQSRDLRALFRYFFPVSNYDNDRVGRNLRHWQSRQVGGSENDKMELFKALIKLTKQSVYQSSLIDEDKIIGLQQRINDWEKRQA